MKVSGDSIMTILKNYFGSKNLVSSWMNTPNLGLKGSIPDKCPKPLLNNYIKDNLVQYYITLEKNDRLFRKSDKKIFTVDRVVNEGLEAILIPGNHKVVRINGRYKLNSEELIVMNTLNVEVL